MFTFYSDPGHGWLKVSVKELVKLGLKPSDFSACSYRAGDNCYLEEDCDAPKFIAAWEARHGQKIAFRERWSNRYSRIHNYPTIHD